MNDNGKEQQKIAELREKMQFVNDSGFLPGGGTVDKLSTSVLAGAGMLLGVLEIKAEKSRIGKQFLGVKPSIGLGIIAYLFALPFYLHLSFLYYCFFAAIICLALPVIPYVKHLPSLREELKAMPVSLATLIGSIVLGAAILSGFNETFCALIFIIAAIAATRDQRFKNVAEESGAIIYFYVFLSMIGVVITVMVYATYQSHLAITANPFDKGMGTTGNFIAVAFLYTVLVVVMWAAMYVAAAKKVYVDVANDIGTYMESKGVKSTRKNINFAMLENGPIVQHYMTAVCAEKGISVDFVRGTGRGNALMTLFNIVGGVAFYFVAAPFIFNSGALMATGFAKRVADHREGEEADLSFMNEEPSGMNDVKKV